MSEEQITEGQKGEAGAQVKDYYMMDCKNHRLKPKTPEPQTASVRYVESVLKRQIK